jgi:hypothetical protein
MVQSVSEARSHSRADARGGAGDEGMDVKRTVAAIGRGLMRSNPVPDVIGSGVYAAFLSPLLAFLICATLFPEAGLFGCIFAMIFAVQASFALGVIVGTVRYLRKRRRSARQETSISHNI